MTISTNKKREKISSSPLQKTLDKFLENRLELVLANPQLPVWHNNARGIPNSILRSALFGAIKRGKRPYIERKSIASVRGISILYTGPRLDQADLDVWSGALHLAQTIKLGNRIEFTEKGFLSLIGRGGENNTNLGKSDRIWLRKVFARLSATTIEVQQGPYVYGGSLIEEYFRDEITGKYIVILNPRMKALFNPNGWTQVDWLIRNALRGYPLAQWLHGFYSTHANPYPYKIETLHQLCGSTTGENTTTDSQRNKALLGWRDKSLIPALNILATVHLKFDQIFLGRVEADGLVHINRQPSSSQKKRIRKYVFNSVTR